MSRHRDEAHGQVATTPGAFWRSLGETHETRQADPTSASIGLVWRERREFLKSLAAASAALAGAGGCSRNPIEPIVPYAKGLQQADYGKPLFYATTFTRGGYATGVLAESNMGRPTKIEGNPAHPASLGATDIFAQASVRDLWDPDRSQTVMRDREISTWDAFLGAIAQQMRALREAQGAGLHILTQTVTSPSLSSQLRALIERYPRAQWHQYQPLNRDAVYRGARLAFGADLEPRYRFERAAVIVSLDADFLDGCPGAVRYARDFATTRRADGLRAMSRLYAVESMPRITGAVADHRIAMRASDIDVLARSLAQQLKVPGVVSERSSVAEAWMSAVVRDLQMHRGRSLIIAGDEQPAHVHALAHAMNSALGNSAQTVEYIRAVAADPSNQQESVADLASAMHAGDVRALLVLGSNPAYHAPADLEFAAALKKVPLSVHWGLHRDETAALCRWHVPAAHYLEAWGDARAFDGTVSMIQPLIAPLYDGRSAHEMLDALSGDGYRAGYDIVRAYWQKQIGAADFERFWTGALHEGLVRDSAFATQKVTMRTLPPLPVLQSVPGLEVIFRADPTIEDGHYANNAWLQELPKPISKLTWDNAVCVSPALAAQLSVQSEDVVELHVNGRTVSGPIWITPGHADGAVSVQLGYGRSRAGTVGNRCGFDAYRLRVSAAPWMQPGVEVRKTGRRYLLACAQTHHSMQGRDLVRVYTAEQAAARVAGGKENVGSEQPSLYPPFQHSGYAWGMSVDLNACIGCSACTIACQAENNIAVVGKDEVHRGREMHWIRVDRYYQGTAEQPRTAFQPVPCMQCEHAPCESVCPVEASVHDSEGINVQVYNRCVGTRFCSNNCPYKVRRFNFFQYAQDVESLNAQRNPEVTVRMRGVMEKCNYCLQRITNARIEADKADRRIRDGEVVTACQAVCPARAIVFGDLNDPSSGVNRVKASPLDYTLLEELNTRPRTTYLARVINPAPDFGEL